MPVIINNYQNYRWDFSYYSRKYGPLIKQLNITMKNDEFIFFNLLSINQFINANMNYFFDKYYRLNYQKDKILDNNNNKLKYGSKVK
jgi:hypothetical protein